MQYHKLGRAGPIVSALGCGTNILQKYTPAEVDRVLNYALDRGITLIETCRCYGAAESLIARAVGHRRQEYTLISKTVHHTAAEVREDVETSLRTMGIERFDGYELAIVSEADVEALLAAGGPIAELERLRDEGKIGTIGLTGHRPELLAQAVRSGRIDHVLFILNWVQPHAAYELLPLARELGVGTMVMRPLGHGMLQPTERAMRYVRSHSPDVILVGMYSPEEVDAAIAAMESPLSPEEAAELQQEQAELPTADCRMCALCKCPHEIDIPLLLLHQFYRERYGLLPAGEREWQAKAPLAARCDECGQCEAQCPYGLTIIPYIRRVARQGSSSG